MTEGMYGPSHDDSKTRSLGPGADAMRDADFETLALHIGQDPDPLTGAIIPPIYASSTYAQDAVANPRWGYVYSRPANPTRRALESCLAALEAAEYAVSFPSGMAAADAVFRTVLKPGDHVILPTDVYGGMFRLLDKVLAKWGIEFSAADIWDLEAVNQAIRPGRTKLIWAETPTNPILGIADLKGLSEMARDAQVLLVVDNTLASPYLQQPLLWGADIVVHSTTKYLGGHSDLLGGAAMFNGSDRWEAIRLHQNAMGSVPSPFDAWLTLRGLKTLAIRMDRQCETAMAIAEHLSEHSKVESVFYPGLATHPNHDVAAKQMRHFGGVVSFTLRGGADAAIEACNSARLFTLGESFGAVESLICYPLRMTHIASAGSLVAPPDNIVRLSVGLESARNLIADLDQAIGS